MPKEYKRDWMRKWRASNRTLDLAQRNAFKEAHPHYSRDYYRKHRKRLTAAINWTVRGAYTKRQVDSISEEYARRKLSFKTGVPMSAWPADMVRLNQAELKLKRLCRKLRITTNSETNSSKPLNS